MQLTVIKLTTYEAQDDNKRHEQSVVVSRSVPYSFDCSITPVVRDTYTGAYRRCVFES